MARSKEVPKKPMAAPTRNLPWESRVALGYWSDLTKSLRVNRPLRRPSASTKGSFSILWAASSLRASEGAVPTGAVTSGAWVMTSLTGLDMSSSKRMSRLVMMPTSLVRSSTTGTPEIRYLWHSSSASAMVASGEMVIGSSTMPASERFT